MTKTEPTADAKLLAMADDALTLLEGWIRRYCKPSFLSEHLDDLAKKRAILEAAKSSPSYVGVSPSPDEACDRAYVNGLRAGWNFGLANDKRGFAVAVDCRDAEIRRARISGSR